MSRRNGLVLPVLTVVALLFLDTATAMAEMPDPAALERLRQVAAAHPDDPDLAWALARELADGGDPDAALGALYARQDSLEDYVSRHVLAQPWRAHVNSLASALQGVEETLGRHRGAINAQANFLREMQAWQEEPTAPHIPSQTEEVNDE